MGSTAIDTGLMALVVDAAADKKAEGVEVLDLSGLGSTITDCFVICHGRTARQVQAISDHVEEALRKARRRPAHVEGYATGEWILMDYLDFVVHIFTQEKRKFYQLERLWADAPRLALDGRPDRSFDKRGATD